MQPGCVTVQVPDIASASLPPRSREHELPRTRWTVMHLASGRHPFWRSATFGLVAWSRPTVAWPASLVALEQRRGLAHLRHDARDSDDRETCVRRQARVLESVRRVGGRRATLHERSCASWADGACEYVVSWEEPVTAAPTAIAGAVLAFGLVLATQVAGLPGVAWAALPASVAALHAGRVRRSARANRMADRNAVLAFRWLVERAKTRRAQAEEAGDRACSGAAAPARQVPILEKDGDFWRIQHDGTSVLLRHSRGLALLARLVDSPGQGIHVRDLDAMTPSGGTAIARESPAPDGGTMPVAGDAGEVLDARARDEYRRRVGELRAELQDAEECHDAGRVES